MSLDSGLQRLWYGPAWLSVPLWPLSGLFSLITRLRTVGYASGLLRSYRVAVPVVVVGNITVGGTGKTPVAAWLAGELGALGYRVGVVLRGYGGSHRGDPVVVAPESDPSIVGDEAVLHARRAVHVVISGADRVAAANLAIDNGAEVVVCDDGLQHLRLQRDCELAVIDRARGVGNGLLLPAGPLRESSSRLSRVDAVVLTERDDAVGGRHDLPAPLLARASLRPGVAVNLRNGEQRALAAFRGQSLHAVAGIGNPEAFFTGLRAAGLNLTAHAIPDHARLDADMLSSLHEEPVLMTEKDAVKYRDFAGPQWWYVELEIEFESESAEALLELVLARTGLTADGGARG